MSSEQLLKLAADKTTDFDPIVDGWVLPEQPSHIFSQGKQARIPLIVGSNADEVSIFASPLVGGTSYRPKTVDEYQQWLRNTFHERAGQAFAAYPVKTDSDVSSAFLHLGTDFDFGFGAWLLARQTRAAGQQVFLYHFTYVGRGKFTHLGAFHSEESMLLSKKYWTSWKPDRADEKLSNVMIAYWTQFAKTSQPNGPGLPSWPAYDSRYDLCQELGTRNDFAVAGLRQNAAEISPAFLLRETFFAER